MTTITLGKTLKNMTTTFGLNVTMDKDSEVTVIPFGPETFLISQSPTVEVEMASIQPYSNFLEWLQSTEEPTNV